MWLLELKITIKKIKMWLFKSEKQRQIDGWTKDFKRLLIYRVEKLRTEDVGTVARNLYVDVASSYIGGEITEEYVIKQRKIRNNYNMNEEIRKVAINFIFDKASPEELNDVVNDFISDGLSDFGYDVLLRLSEYHRGDWTELQLKLEVAKLLLK